MTEICSKVHICEVTSLPVPHMSAAAKGSEWIPCTAALQRYTTLPYPESETSFSLSNSFLLLCEG